jgi:hypothetical protein
MIGAARSAGESRLALAVTIPHALVLEGKWPQTAFTHLLSHHSRKAIPAMLGYRAFSVVAGSLYQVGHPAALLLRHLRSSNHACVWRHPKYPDYHLYPQHVVLSVSKKSQISLGHAAGMRMAIVIPVTLTGGAHTEQGCDASCPRRDTKT